MRDLSLPVADLSASAVAAVDSQNLIADVLNSHEQLADALWRVDSAPLRRVDASRGLLVCGMGGSAIGGNLAMAAIGGRVRRPIRSVRGYDLEPWVDSDTLVLCASYSGSTEETLSCYAAAREAGAHRIVLTTGGPLAEQAREDGVPVIGVPSGMQPRTAFLYAVVGTLKCAELCGAAPSLEPEVEAARALLEGLAADWGPDSPGDSLAKEVAGRLHGSVPVIFGAGRTAPAAMRWKGQFNENAEIPAFWAALPEADHNEICAWGGGAEGLANLAAVFLDDDSLDPRLRRRLELTSEIVAPGTRDVVHVEARGASPLERVLSLVFLGDLASIYLAVLRGTDPTPVERIEQFKEALWTSGASADS